ncbi:MAG: recombinase family protein [Planctomycetes bacterium]|nr:recombinase family protein [Planctomycetota bacterium]
MRVALYARVSDPKESRGTIESQIELLQAHAREEGYEVAAAYVCRDRYTGTALARPELDRLRDGAQAGAFDAVLVHDPDRLSRKYAYQILILEEFERLGIPLIFLEQPPPDDPKSVLLVQIQGAVAEYERTKIAERCRRGKLSRARQGEVFWRSVPYGYRRVPRQDGVPAHLVVDDAQAEVVRTVFAWHADEGMSVRRIARRLTRQGHPTPRGGPHWGETTVHRILRREAYLGVLYYNTSCRTSVPSTDGAAPRQKQSPRPPAEWIALSIPPLVDRDLFERSQARHDPNRQFSPRNLHEEHWLLRRLLRCGRCGRKSSCVADRRPPHRPPAHYYRCRQPRVPGQPCCRPNHVRAQPLDALVWEEVRKHLLHPEFLLRAQTLRLESTSPDASFLSTQVDHAKQRLARVRAERRRLLDAYQAGFVDKKDFEERAGIVARRVDTLEKELDALEEEHRHATEDHQLLERISTFAASITQRLDQMDFHQRQALVRAVLEEVVLCDDTVKLYFKIPLPRPPTSSTEAGGPTRRPGVSSSLDLRSRRDSRRGVWAPSRQRPADLRGGTTTHR